LERRWRGHDWDRGWGWGGWASSRLAVLRVLLGPDGRLPGILGVWPLVVGVAGLLVLSGLQLRLAGQSAAVTDRTSSPNHTRSRDPSASWGLSKLRTRFHRAPTMMTTISISTPDRATGNNGSAGARPRSPKLRRTVRSTGSVAEYPRLAVFERGSRCAARAN